MSDINMMRIILEFVFNKLEIMVNGMESKEKADEAHDCTLMVMDIMKRKTYR
jgi:hypothetical protein